MITKTQIKFVQSLAKQKYRKENQAYLVEGEKNAAEWMKADTIITHCFATKEWLQENENFIQSHHQTEFQEVKEFELEKISALTHAQKVILIVKIPSAMPFKKKNGEWVMFLERIQDPGNMGTIIRIADWFGISTILISPDCVDIYNPKVVQATMGSHTRIHFKEQTILELKEIIDEAFPLYAASLSGQSIYNYNSPIPGILAFGNESAGLSTETLALSQFQITIPRKGNAESLNVAVATGIICALFLR